MELLKAALFVTLLAAASARPTDWRQHQDADIADTDWTPERPDDTSHWASRSSESFSREDSSESSESRSSSSSEESSEEVLLPDVTTTTTGTTTGDDGSALSPEPDTPGTDEPAATTTDEPGRQTPATPACDQCFTVEIPTEAPITNNRGDN